MVIGLSVALVILAVVIVAVDLYWKPVMPKLKFPWPHRKQHELISVLIPYRGDGARRTANFTWLLEFYKSSALAEHAEFIVGSDDSVPFCKTHAVNDAFRKAHGDIIVILDADCFIRPDTILNAAQQIRHARQRRRKVWFIPYRRFYRLTEQATDKLLGSDPVNPWHIPDPPPEWAYEHQHNISAGHWWGALIQVMPREAFVAAGGMDENFSGWGGEDISFMYAIDTLWARHKTIDGPTYHLWHPMIKGDWKFTRQWEGQPTAEMNNDLAGKYSEAVGDIDAMRDLINRHNSIS